MGQFLAKRKRFEVSEGDVAKWVSDSCTAPIDRRFFYLLFISTLSTSLRIIIPRLLGRFWSGRVMPTPRTHTPRTHPAHTPHTGARLPPGRLPVLPDRRFGVRGVGSSPHDSALPRDVAELLPDVAELPPRPPRVLPGRAPLLQRSYLIVNETAVGLGLN